MRLTKHAHATVALADGERSLLIDPGTFTSNSAELIAAATAILITHDHPDHFDPSVIATALLARPELRVWAPASLAENHADFAAGTELAGRITAVAPGDSITANGFEVRAVGGEHAVIHRDLPSLSNVGYVINGDVYHPGDAYFVPEIPVETLLAPTSGPWTKLTDLVDFIRAVAPKRTVQIHDLMLSDLGRGSFARFTKRLTGQELLTLAPGESLEL